MTFVRVGLLRKRYESILKDKSSKLQLLSGTEQFRKRVDKMLSWFSGLLRHYYYSTHAGTQYFWKNQKQLRFRLLLSFTSFIIFSLSL
jgi:hypothetical protein